ncbi:MAG: galactokinase [Clostridia bacterium]|nr:galactokinase [Clostridia bacterium]
MKTLKNPYESVQSVFEKFSLLYGENSIKQQERYIKIFNEFKSIFGAKNAYFISSSGRAEIIGNHTDHNGGKVIACSISLDTVAAFLPRGDNKIKLVSQGYPIIELDTLSNEVCEKGTSKALVKGVLEGLRNYGYKVGGFNAYVESDVVGGVGISSSASYELLVCEILNFLYNDNVVSPEERAKICQFSESEYFGKPCGLLDQTAISFGGLNLLDFEKDYIQVEKIEEDLKDYALVLINTGGSHADLTDEYAAVRTEMKEVASFFGVERLIDINMEDFLYNLPKMKNLSDRAILRAIHFFEENERVILAEESLRKKDYSTFLDCVNKSGISSIVNLQNCHVNGSLNQPIIRSLSVCKNFIKDGANRVHGGGFAGGIINFVKKENLSEFLNAVEKIFSKKDVVSFLIRGEGVLVL